MKVYCKSGENLVTAIEGPITKVWLTKYCVLIEKDPSTTVIDSHPIPMPRLFSIVHPLDDMYPVLIKTNMNVNYVTEAEYKVGSVIFYENLFNIFILDNFHVGRERFDADV